MSIIQLIQHEIKQSLDTFAAIEKNPTVHQTLQTIIVSCVDSLQSGGKLMFMGNGGSAADAQHLAAELICRFQKNRQAIPALALTTDTSILTAVSNDFSYDAIFSRQIEALATPQDCLIAISTSGNSNNIFQAILTAKTMGVKTFGLSGKTGGKMKNLCHECLCVPSEITAKIQEAHICLGHILCQALEERFSQQPLKHSLSETQLP
ncbi:MAG TPA: D-sedoheptulose 7-phosphate isomerase [Gammaproteobacteria bacterium]|nr:D-sedoheptulose 7-phosphate isomerase [Gammaproteobacteria bacterium]